MTSIRADAVRQKCALNGRCRVTPLYRMPSPPLPLDGWKGLHSHLRTYFGVRNRSSIFCNHRTDPFVSAAHGCSKCFAQPIQCHRWSCDPGRVLVRCRCGKEKRLGPRSRPVVSTRLTHLLCILGAITIPFFARGEAFRIEGHMTKELFKPVRGSAANQTVEGVYSISTDGTNWITRIATSGTPWDYIEAGSHEGNVFTLVSMQTRRQAIGGSGNEYAGRVLRGPVPHVYLSGPIAVLWYVYASSDYLHSLSNNAAEPPLLPLGTDRELHKWRFLQRISVRRNEAPPFLPAEITFHNDGISRQWKQRHYSDHLPAEEQPRVPALRAGYTNSHMIVHSWIQAGEYLLPAESEFFLFEVASPGLSTDDVLLLRRYRFVATNALVTQPKSDWRPQFAGVIPVGDERFSRVPDILPAFDYQVTNRWLTDDEVRTLPQYASAVEMAGIGAIAVQAEMRRLSPVYWILGVGVLVVLVLLPLFMVHAWKRARRARSMDT
jgi:hypothetical protein